MIYFETKKITIWVNFGRKMVVFLWPFCSIYSQMVYLIAIWYMYFVVHTVVYFSRLGMFCREKSVNPATNYPSVEASFYNTSSPLG
jgi:hypothetical protein